MSELIAKQVAQLRAGLPALRASDALTRAAKIERLLAATLARQDEIRTTVRAELGLCDTDIDAQLMMIKTEAEFIVKHLKTWMRPTPIHSSLMSLGKKSYLQYEPKGLVLVLGTWNAPYAIGFVPAFGAIAAGNAVVIKPSELAPASSALMAEILAQADLADTVAVVEGGADAAQALLAQPFHHVFYIGGHHVGRLVMKAAAEHFASVTLEMGGKNPVLVDRSADLADAARKIAWGRLSNAGQICIAPEYVLVHNEVEAAFTAALRDAMCALYNPDGKGFEHSPEYPRIINVRHHQRIMALLTDARDKGAKLVLGGEADEAQRYIAPTIVAQVSEEMRLMQEEVFGPVIAVVPYTDPQQAVDYIARRPKPLSSYIYARDRAVIDFFLANTTAGSSVVNHNVIQSGTNPYLPFGGVNDSGIGRIGGHASFLETANARSVVEEGPLLMAPDLMFPPYGDKYKRMISDMLNKKMNVPDAVVRAIHRMVRLRRGLTPR